MSKIKSSFVPFIVQLGAAHVFAFVVLLPVILWSTTISTTGNPALALVLIVNAAAACFALPSTALQSLGGRERINSLIVGFVLAVWFCAWIHVNPPESAALVKFVACALFTLGFAVISRGCTYVGNLAVDKFACL